MIMSTENQPRSLTGTGISQEQIDLATENFRQQCRFTALSYAPKHRSSLDPHIQEPLNAEEVIKEAEIIYNWLIRK